MVSRYVFVSLLTFALCDASYSPGGSLWPTASPASPCGDAWFLVDSSKHVKWTSDGSSEWEQVKNFMYSVVDAFQPWPRTQRVGAVNFGTVPNFLMGVATRSKTQAKSWLKHELDTYATQTVGNAANLGSALRLLTTGSGVSGALPGLLNAKGLTSQRVVMVILGSNPTGNPCRYLAALQERKTNVIVVGVRNKALGSSAFAPRKLACLASAINGKSQVFTVNSYSQLMGLAKKMATLLCDRRLRAARSVTAKPTGQPTQHPTSQPTQAPTLRPTIDPTAKPTVSPTVSPTDQPSTRPTEQPSVHPTVAPSERPTIQPTVSPTTRPTEPPTNRPTHQPTEQPTTRPSVSPTEQPTTPPTPAPTEQPTTRPTIQPTEWPTRPPSEAPSVRVLPTKPPTAAAAFCGDVIFVVDHSSTVGAYRWRQYVIPTVRAMVKRAVTGRFAVVGYSASPRLFFGFASKALTLQKLASKMNSFSSFGKANLKGGLNMALTQLVPKMTSKHKLIVVVNAGIPSSCVCPSYVERNPCYKAANFGNKFRAAGVATALVVLGKGAIIDSPACMMSLEKNGRRAFAHCPNCLQGKSAVETFVDTAPRFVCGADLIYPSPMKPSSGGEERGSEEESDGSPYFE